jgi:anti-sigma factor RsiW
MRHLRVCLHAHVRMLLGVYALGVMTPEEVRALEAHLTRCQLCRTEGEDLLEAAAYLGRLAALGLAAGDSPLPAPTFCPVRPRRSTTGSAARTRRRSGSPGAGGA